MSEMDYKSITRLSTLLAKAFAEDIIKLLLKYRDISASEAASRLDLHIKTAQDFLEELAALDIVDKTEVKEKKRPYFRYKLKKPKLTVEIDFTTLFRKTEPENNTLQRRIREKKHAPVNFTTSASNNYISNVVVLIGKGRKRKERRFSLTKIQGRFMFHLPFPTEEPKTIEHIIEKAGLSKTDSSEILDIVDVLIDYGVIEVV